jgi:hypothetical protein
MLSMIADSPANSALYNCLPFSQRLSHAVLTQCAQRFAQSLNLSTDVRLIEGNGLCGLNSERRFRLKWWLTGNEPLRDALQRAKTLVYCRARAGQDGSVALNEAWRCAEQMVKSERWRRHLSQITLGLSSADKTYLRLVYSVSQQAWSRAARWQAVMRTGRPSPFQLLIQMLAAGAWPLGYYENSLCCFIWNKAVPDTLDFGPLVPPDNHARPEDYIFLSALFRDSAFIAEWEAAFSVHGWKTLHGPVSENTAPPEPQLGKRIRSARAVIGILAEADPDFGLPWWMFQELDYAAACKRPVALITRPGFADKLLPGVQVITHELDFDSTQERGIWRWLRNNAS